MSHTASLVQVVALNCLYIRHRGRDVRAGVRDCGQVDNVAVENLLIPELKEAHEVMLQ